MIPIDAQLVSVIPETTSDPAEAFRLLRRDGAVIVSGHPAGATDVGPLLQAVFGGALRHVGDPVEVRAAGGRDRPDLDADGHRQRTPLHSDGFALGDASPDVLALGCEIAVTGGESFMVDMDRVHDQLMRAGGQWMDLAAFLVDHPVDQTEPGKVSSTGTIGLPRPEGGYAWRCSYHLAPLPEERDVRGTQLLLDRWLELLDDLAGAATRFRLDAGEVLIGDNTLVFHGRDPYDDTSRLLWRVWGWSERAVVPDTEYRISDTSQIGVPA